MTARLDTVANVATILACLLLIVALAPRLLRQPVPTSEPYQPGDALPAIAGLQYSGSDRTVLLFVRSTCVYCTASMPFYRALVHGPHFLQERHYRVVAIGHEPRETIAAYFAKHNVAVDEALSIDPGATAVTRTPTLLLVDGTGRVLGSWTGQLTAEREATVRLRIKEL